MRSEQWPGTQSLQAVSCHKDAELWILRVENLHNELQIALMSFDRVSVEFESLLQWFPPIQHIQI